METLSWFITFLVLFGPSVTSNDFCPSDPTMTNLEGQLQQLQDALTDHIEHSDRCNCGSTCNGPDPTTTTAPPPTTPEPDDCPGTELFVTSDFIEIEYTSDFTDDTSVAFLTTKVSLIGCMKEILETLPGHICVDVIEIVNANTGGVTVQYKLIYDDQQTEDEIRTTMTANTGSASLCSDYKYGVFYHFSSSGNQISWKVVASTGPEYYRITLPLCVSMDGGVTYERDTPEFSALAESLTTDLNSYFEGVSGDQEVEIKEFLPAETNGQHTVLALLVLKTERFYSLRGFQDSFWKIMDTNFTGSCPTREDFTITDYPLSRHQLQLADGNIPSIGRAEFLDGGVWGTICSSTGYRVREWPRVFCREKGFPDALGASKARKVNIPQGASIPAPYLSNSRCPGSTSSIYKCRKEHGQPDCEHQQDMAVNCEPLVRLTGGELVREGLVQFYDGTNWGSICALSLDGTDGNTDWAEVTCKELGYTGVEEVKYLRNSPFASVTSPRITFMNPDCNVETTDTMQDCGQRPDKLACRHSDSVYLKCQGPQDEVPLDLHEPIYGDVTCKQKVYVYADGALIDSKIANYRDILRVEIPSDTEVIGIICKKVNTGGILASFSNGLKSDRDWMCSVAPQANTDWMTMAYNDSHWETPEEKASVNELPFGSVNGWKNEDSKWIWMHWREGGPQTMYCRSPIVRPPTVKLVGGSRKSIGFSTSVDEDDDSASVVGDYRFFTPNWASVSCREQGYPWAEAVAGAAQSGLDSTSYIQNSFNPDFCPAVNDGIMPECEKFNSGDAVPEAVAVKCRERLELVDGDGPHAGRLRIFRGYTQRQWTTACDFNPQTDNYERVCRELGFSRLNRVMTLSGAGLNVSIAVEPISLHNAVCNDVDQSIFECRSNPLYKECTHDDDVYITCYEDRADDPPALVPDSGRVSCGLGSVVTIYADGLDVATGSETIEGTIPKDVDVIGVECTWPEQEDAGEMIAEFSNGINSDDKWQCSIEFEDHWNTIHFNPREYRKAIVVDEGTFDFPVTSKSLGTHLGNISNTIYCRRQVADIFRVTMEFQRDHDDATEVEFSAAFQAAAAYYEPLLTALFDSEPGKQTAVVVSFSAGGNYADYTYPGDSSRKRRAVTASTQIVTWQLRSVANDDIASFRTLLRNDILDDNQVIGLNVRMEHFTLVDVDIMYWYLRLVDGPNEHTGRVEVYRHGIWGPVCENRFWIKDFPELFCKTRQYRKAVGAAWALKVGYPIGTTQHTIINPYECNEHSNSPYSCVRDPYGDYTHDEDLAIRCESKTRLSGGELTREGKLEIWNGSEWGAVCATDITTDDFADVACFELGFGPPEIVDYVNAFNLEPLDFIALKNPKCNLMTTHAMETCDSDQTECSQEKAVYLKCLEPRKQVPRDLEFPIKGAVTCDSEVQLYADGKFIHSHMNWKIMAHVEVPWYTKAIAIKCTIPTYQGGILASFDTGLVSGDTWDCINDPEDTLKMRDVSKADYDASTWKKSISMGTSNDNDQWRGFPINAFSDHPGMTWMWGQEEQGFTKVICRTYIRKPSDVRLVDGKTSGDGRVEFKVGDTWGPVCDPDLVPGEWPELVCKELGFPGIRSADYTDNVNIARVTTTHTLQSPNCDQYTANYLYQCQNGAPCEHDTDVAIACTPKLRLVDGPRRSEGTVQWFDKEWGYVVDRRSDNTPIDGWPTRACKDLNFPGAESVTWHSVQKGETAPEMVVTSSNPLCADGAASFEDCPDDPQYTDGTHLHAMYLVCTPRPPGTGNGGYRVIDASGSCDGTFKAWVDGSLVYDSAVDNANLGTENFVFPEDVKKKLSVQCYPRTANISLELTTSTSIDGTWRCIRDAVPPIWVHPMFDDRTWPAADVVPGAEDFAITITPMASVPLPGYPVSCSIIIPGSEQPTFPITSPSGCTSLNTYLPDMWNQCNYRTCKYGPNPFINSQGELSIYDEETPCPNEQIVPLSFKAGDTVPCVPDDGHEFCADCRNLNDNHLHPTTNCSFLTCIDSGEQNPQGRLRFITRERHCPAGRGIRNGYEITTNNPCKANRRECAAPATTTPMPTPEPCRDTIADPVHDVTEYFTGCTIISSQAYKNQFPNHRSSAYILFTESIERALNDEFCTLTSRVVFDVTDVRHHPNATEPGVEVEWVMSFTSPPGVEMLVILEKIQEIVDSGELLDYQPTYVTRYEVGDGGCNINLVTIHYQMTTDLKILWNDSYADPTSDAYINLSNGYRADIEELYSSVEGNHVTRILDVRKKTLAVLNEDIDYVQVELDMLTDAQETHDEMEDIFEAAVTSLRIGGYEMATDVALT